MLHDLGSNDHQLCSPTSNALSKNKRHLTMLSSCSRCTYNNLTWQQPYQMSHSEIRGHSSITTDSSMGADQCTETMYLPGVLLRLKRVACMLNRDVRHRGFAFSLTCCRYSLSALVSTWLQSELLLLLSSLISCRTASTDCCIAECCIVCDCLISEVLALIPELQTRQV